MKLLKCRHKGCKLKHKSFTGFCNEHAADVDSHEVHATKGRPELYEETLDRGTTPKVTLK